MRYEDVMATVKEVVKSFDSEVSVVRFKGDSLSISCKKKGVFKEVKVKQGNHQLLKLSMS